MSSQPTLNVDPNSPLGLVEYYANLLIIQYLGKSKAYSTIFSTAAPFVMPQTSVQTLTFSDVAASGNFILQYNGNNTSSIAWNASTSTIQSDLQAVTGLSQVTVSGTIASRVLTITFTGVIPPAQLLVIDSNTLENGSSQGIQITLAETDQTLPIAIWNAFNLMGSSIAQGVQLDILGKYAGVTRNSNGPYGPITLDDSDFLILIKFAIVQNTSGSSLATIESNLYQFFPGQFIVTDYQNMYLSYIFSASLGSTNLFIALIEEDLIPRPMGVGYNIIIPPAVNNFFGFRTYVSPNNLAKPFNTYADWNYTWQWLSYADAFIV